MIHILSMYYLSGIDLNLNTQHYKIMKKPLLNQLIAEDSQLYTTPFSLIQKLESNYNSPDSEIIELMNDSEYLERINMLWNDSAELL